MKFSKKAFSILEVLIASLVLSVTVFWVYKLIGENSRLIGNKDIFTQKNILLLNAQKCLNYWGFSELKNAAINDMSINFGANNSSCFTGTYNTDYSFPSVNMNATNYYISAQITNSWATFIDWDIWVFEESSGKFSKSFTQVP